jgi:hypothetical protein
MGNKLVKYGIIKAIVVFPVSFLLFYVYYKYNISIYFICKYTIYNSLCCRMFFAGQGVIRIGKYK